jgi:hypothetical protein
MKMGHDGAGAGDEFGPNSSWAYIHDNPEDDAVTEEEWADILRPFMDQDDDAADWWKNGK